MELHLMEIFSIRELELKDEIRNWREKQAICNAREREIQKELERRCRKEKAAAARQEELAAENRRLRSLLGLNPSELSPAHIEVAPSLSAVPAAPALAVPAVPALALEAT